MANEQRAQAARQVAVELGDMLYEKQLAYGDSGAIALGVWQARLAQYRVDMATGGDFDIDMLIHNVASVMKGHPQEQAFYILPASLIAHIPRLTRVDDRINRLISNPAGDRLGEDPWRDLAGDAIIGVIMPRVGQLPGKGPADEVGDDLEFAPGFVQTPEQRAEAVFEAEHCASRQPGTGARCMRTPGHGRPHRRMHSGGVMTWWGKEDEPGYTHGFQENGGAGEEE